MRVMGQDLSLAAPGIALGLEQTLTIPVTTKGDHRLITIEDHVTYYLDEWHPDLVVIEDVPAAGSKTKPLMLVHGVVRKELARRRIPFAYVNSSCLKAYATLNGRADKPEMFAAADALGFGPFGDDNQVDAWWLVVMGLHHLGVWWPPRRSPVDMRRMSANLRAVEWPAAPTAPVPRARA
jgi:Holliday junction resolvasome RuvABC endonuclease subunit